ncbi:MAG: hypothetical protein KAR12_16175, partial [Methylococcales bacterium]|nr:hypothetical protein [Methylococcales bacterium]
EEIEMANKAIFLEAGGVSYHYIPALNNSDKHVETIVKLITGEVHGKASQDSDFIKSSLLNKNKS